MILARFIGIVLSIFSAATSLADYSRVDIQVTKGGATGTLHLFLFDSRSAALKIIDQGDMKNPPYKDLSQAMEKHNCLAGCNGGFFGKNGKPLGLVIADGKQSGTINMSSSLTSAVLGQGKDAPFIERSVSYFKRGAKHQQLVQSGPLLVENGKLVSGLSDRKYARRTVIFTNGGTTWGIAYSPATSLALLAKAFADPTTFPTFEVKTAINLDGGASSGLWIRREHHPFYLRELSSVRNFVGVVSK